MAVPMPPLPPVINARFSARFSVIIREGYQ